MRINTIDNRGLLWLANAEVYGHISDVYSISGHRFHCARRKSPAKKGRAPLQQCPVGAPLEKVAMDILGPLPETDRGNIYVLIVGDYFTKWMEAYPLPDQKANTIARVFVEKCICRVGVPRELHTDQGRNFEAGVVQGVCKYL